MQLKTKIARFGVSAVIAGIMIAGLTPATGATAAPAAEPATTETVAAAAGIIFVDNYCVDWSPYCVGMRRGWEGAAANLRGLPVRMTWHNCQLESDLCTSIGIRAYPSILWTRDGVRKSYGGDRTQAGLEKWIRSML